MGRVADAIRRDLKRTTESVVRFIVLDLDRRLRRNPKSGGTPVDTGHARANWVPSVGSPFTSEVSDTSSHDAGVASVIAYKLGDGPAWLSNNVPYIQLLNDGHSKQRPAGFVEVCIAETLAEALQRFGEIARPVVAAATNSIGGQAAGNVASAYSPFGDD